MREYIAALAPGSYVVFSHFLDPDVPDLTEVAKRIEQILVQGPLGAGRFRTATEIEAVLPGSGDPATEPGKRAVGGRLRRVVARRPADHPAEQRGTVHRRSGRQEALTYETTQNRVKQG